MSSFEVFIGVVCATIPTLRPGYNFFKDKMRGKYATWKNQSVSRKRSYQTFGNNVTILSPPAAHTQGQLLEELGIVKTTTIDVDPESVDRSGDYSSPSLHFDKN
jgi:hypothetical protein